MRASTALSTLCSPACALAVPLLGIYPVFMMKLLCFAMFACAFNLLLGFSGMLSFGHAAFFGGAAYVTGWLVTAHGWGTLAAIAGRHGWPRRCSGSSSARSRSGARASTSR